MRTATLTGITVALSLALVGAVRLAKADTRGTVAQTFDTGFDAVRTGAKESVRVGSFVITKSREGAIRVAQSFQGSAPTGVEMADAIVTTKIKAKLAADKDINSGNVDVSTDAGIVTVKGQVKTEHEAIMALSDTLATDGVVAVNSMLTWPGSAPAPSGVIMKRP